MMVLIKELKQVFLSDVGPLHFALGDQQPASPSWLSFWSHECIFHIQRWCLVMSNEGTWYTTLGFSGEQKHTLMLQNCLIVNYIREKWIHTNHTVKCAAIIITAILCDNEFNIYLLNAVLPIFKLHLLDSVSSSFLLMSWGSKDRPIVSCFSFYNHTWIQSICIPVPCSFALSVGRSQTVCDVNLTARAHTNMQGWRDHMQMIRLRCT